LNTPEQILAAIQEMKAAGIVFTSTDDQPKDLELNEADLKMFPARSRFCDPKGR
jgi:hypothetical protein